MIRVPYVDIGKQGRELREGLLAAADLGDALQEFLAEQGVDSRIHYPVPIHRQPAFERYGPRTPCLFPRH